MRTLPICMFVWAVAGCAASIQPDPVPDPAPDPDLTPEPIDPVADELCGAGGGEIDAVRYVSVLAACTGSGCAVGEVPTFLSTVVASVDGGSVYLDYGRDTQVLVAFYEDMAGRFVPGESMTLEVSDFVTTLHGETTRAVIAAADTEDMDVVSLTIPSGPTVSLGSEICAALPTEEDRRCPESETALLARNHVLVETDSSSYEVRNAETDVIDGWYVVGFAGGFDCSDGFTIRSIGVNLFGPPLPADEVPTEP